ncbi:hypothetical protein SDC9_189575 [bioreactor metagenome]|uniref:Uncharacterized protein n=1 Tax=bioreactor metagenome TaxID=1076179 RepID=A0A645HV00_9ZZZZ
MQFCRKLYDLRQIILFLKFALPAFNPGQGIIYIFPIFHTYVTIQGHIIGYSRGKSLLYEVVYRSKYKKEVASPDVGSFEAFCSLARIQF